IESLRADRIVGPFHGLDPLANLRELSSHGTVRSVLASSSDSLPSLASILTGQGPERHGMLVEGLDRLPTGTPTLASVLGAAGFRTAGYPSMASLGLSSGLSRGFS